MLVCFSAFCQENGCCGTNPSNNLCQDCSADFCSKAPTGEQITVCASEANCCSKLIDDNCGLCESFVCEAVRCRQLEDCGTECSVQECTKDLVVSNLVCNNDYSACCGFTKNRNRNKRFRFLMDLDEFQPTPDQSQIDHILSDIEEGDLDAKFIATDNILPKDVLQAAVEYVETAFDNKEFVTDKDKQEFKLSISGQDLVKLLGKELVVDLLVFMDQFTGHVEDRDGHSPITGAFFQRFDHDNDTVSPYHTDGNAVSLVALLNDDYEGGEMTFLTSGGPVVTETKAGSATIHGAGVVHGNSAIDGVKYQLTLLTFPHTKRASIFDDEAMLVEAS